MLATDEHSNVLIYMNGHGGDQFLKFHDMEEVSSHDLGGALREMELKKRYHRVGDAFVCTRTCCSVPVLSGKAYFAKGVEGIGAVVTGTSSRTATLY